MPGKTPEEARKKEFEVLKMPKTPKDAWQILGLQENSSVAEIKKAYRKLALQYHPDQAFSPEENSKLLLLGEKRKRGENLNDEEKGELAVLAKKAENFHAVNKAYEILQNEAKKGASGKHQTGKTCQTKKKLPNFSF